jgi:hypothetical protein
VTDVTALGDHSWPLIIDDEKSEPYFLVGATFMALNTADMYIRADVNASYK